MKVKTRITFEVVYPLELEFYETDDEETALEMERACINEDPFGIIEAFGPRGNGIFTTSVERVKLVEHVELSHEEKLEILKGHLLRALRG